MAKYKILDWHGIPSQVRARDGNGRHGVRLSDRFQEAIDRAAMLAKLSGEDDYTDGFKWGMDGERSGSAQEVSEAVAAEIEEQYSEADLKGLVNKIRQENKKK